MRCISFYFTLDRAFKQGEYNRSIKTNLNLLETSIYLSWSVNGKYQKQCIGHRIKPTEWDFNLKQPLRKYQNYLELNTLLNKIKSSCEREYLYMRTNDIPVTVESIKSMVRNMIVSASSDIKPIWSVYNEFISEKALTTKPATIVKYESTLKSLKKFEEDQYQLNFCNISTKKFYNDFLGYSHTKLNHLNATTSKNVQNIKGFLQWCKEHPQRYVRTDEFRQFKCRTDYTHPIFLTLHELQQIENYSAGITYAVTKDLFLFLCYTGQRISDANVLKVRHIKRINGNSFEWELYQQKGNKTIPVYIPIIGHAFSILSKYIMDKNSDDYVFPRQPAATTNKHLKIIGKAAGLTDLTTKVNFSGKTRHEICLPKYEFLTTHVGRRTFITLLRQNNFSDVDIRSISGHASTKEMLPYIGVNRQVVRQNLENLFATQA